RVSLAHESLVSVLQRCPFSCHQRSNLSLREYHSRQLNCSFILPDLVKLLLKAASFSPTKVSLLDPRPDCLRNPHVQRRQFRFLETPTRHFFHGTLSRATELFFLIHPNGCRHGQDRLPAHNFADASRAIDQGSYQQL